MDTLRDGSKRRPNVTGGSTAIVVAYSGNSPDHQMGESPDVGSNVFIVIRMFGSIDSGPPE